MRDEASGGVEMKRQGGRDPVREKETDGSEAEAAWALQVVGEHCSSQVLAFRYLRWQPLPNG